MPWVKPRPITFLRSYNLKSEFQNWGGSRHLSIFQGPKGSKIWQSKRWAPCELKAHLGSPCSWAIEHPWLWPLQAGRCALVQRRAHFSAFVDNHVWYAEHLCTCAGEEELVAWGLDYHRFITTDASEHSPPRCTVRVPTFENIQKPCPLMQ